MKDLNRQESYTFLSTGAPTGKLATVREDGRPHVAPIWFILDGDDLVFTTFHTTVKGRNLRRDPRLMLSVDDEAYPYTFVLVEGTAEIQALSPEELLPWTTRIARRYVPAGRVEEYGRRNAYPGELFVRVTVSRLIGKQGIAD